VPHRVNKDDWFDGMLIPKDATAVIPIWAIQNSEKHGFEDPTTYRPERYERHPRLAPEYAGSPDYENRDEFLFLFSRPFLSRLSSAPSSPFKQAHRPRRLH
jgi:hypothetical protein